MGLRKGVECFKKKKEMRETGGPSPRLHRKLRKGTEVILKAVVDAAQRTPSLRKIILKTLLIISQCERPKLSNDSNPTRNKQENGADMAVCMQKRSTEKSLSLCDILS